MPTPAPMRIPALEAAARDCIGDGKRPNFYAVTDQGVVVTITREGQLAYKHWRKLAERRPYVESALESRAIGTICSVDPPDEDGNDWRIIDDRRLDPEL